MLKSAEDAKCLLELKCISISVLGLHNSGKSTITNALLGDEYVSCVLLNLVILLYRILENGPLHIQH